MLLLWSHQLHPYRL
ncbi:Glutamyl-tRNA(Gln) amidotransferase subunit A, partial [Fusarium oxysporum f. sp. albedinis]